MLFVNTAESGTPGATVTAAGSASPDAWTSVTVNTNTLTYDNTVPTTGSLAYKFSVGGSLAAVYAEKTLGGTFTTLNGYFYYYSPIHPGSSLRIVQFLNGATPLGYLGISNSVSKLTWYNSANTAATATGSGFPLSTLIRVEYTVTLGSTTTGSGTARFFLGNDMTPQGVDSTATAQNFGTTGADTIRFGNTGANFTISSAFWGEPFAASDAAVSIPTPQVYTKLSMKGRR